MKNKYDYKWRDAKKEIAKEREELTLLWNCGVAKRNKALLSPKVLSDRKTIRSFFLARQNQRIPGSEKLYDQFLIWNKQASGINSYNDVLLWALAYQKKQH